MYKLYSYQFLFNQSLGQSQVKSDYKFIALDALGYHNARILRLLGMGDLKQARRVSASPNRWRAPPKDSASLNMHVNLVPHKQ